MIYIIAENNYHYEALEILTESIFKIDKAEVRGIRDNNIALLNANIIPNDKLELHKWPKEMEQPNKSLNYKVHYEFLIGQVDQERFKVVAVGGWFKTKYVNKQELQQMIMNNQLNNCNYINNSMQSCDTHNLYTEQSFRDNINNKYAEFIAKAKLMGHDMSFDYVVEGKHVKIYKYTGNSDEVIIPNFVTDIMVGAFQKKGIKTLKLNNGIELIGNKAFTENEIDKLVIPKTVKFIGESAFGDNRITKKTGQHLRGFDENKVTIENQNTLILNQKYWE